MKNVSGWLCFLFSVFFFFFVVVQQFRSTCDSFGLLYFLGSSSSDELPYRSGYFQMWVSLVSLGYLYAFPSVQIVELCRTSKARSTSPAAAVHSSESSIRLRCRGCATVLNSVHILSVCWNKSPCLRTQTAACPQAPPRTGSPAPPPMSRASTRERTAPERGCGCSRDSAWYTWRHHINANERNDRQTSPWVFCKSPAKMNLFEVIKSENADEMRAMSHLNIPTLFHCAGSLWRSEI